MEKMMEPRHEQIYTIFLVRGCRREFAEGVLQLVEVFYLDHIKRHVLFLEAGSIQYELHGPNCKENKACCLVIRMGKCKCVHCRRL